MAEYNVKYTSIEEKITTQKKHLTNIVNDLAEIKHEINSIDVCEYWTGPLSNDFFESFKKFTNYSKDESDDSYEWLVNEYGGKINEFLEKAKEKYATSDNEIAKKVGDN